MKSMEKCVYEKPQIEVVEVEVNQCICSSIIGGGNVGTSNDYVGGESDTHWEGSF